MNTDPEEPKALYVCRRFFHRYRCLVKVTVAREGMGRPWWLVGPGRGGAMGGRIPEETLLQA